MSRLLAAVCLLLAGPFRTRGGPLAGLLLTLAQAHAGSVTLAWDAVTDNSVAAYHIYYGTASGFYSCMINAGTNTTATVSNLLAGTTYYFAATQLSSLGTESDYSAELTYSVPAAAPVLFALRNCVQFYDGTPKTPTVLAWPTNAPYQLLISGAAAAPSSPGSYPICVASASPDYSGATNATLQIVDRSTSAILSWSSPLLQTAANWASNVPTLFCSTNLKTWTALTNDASQGAILLAKPAPCCFFRARAPVPLLLSLH